MHFSKTTDISRAMYAREAGQVQRCHSLPSIGSYDNAQHSFNMAVLLRILKPDFSANLLWAILAHDLGERAVGDIPHQTKKASSEFSDYITCLENEVLAGANLQAEPLTDEEHKWLKGLDVLEFYFWISEQCSMGNKRLFKEKHKVEERLLMAMDVLPKPIYDLYVMKMNTHDLGMENNGWNNDVA